MGILRRVREEVVDTLNPFTSDKAYRRKRFGTPPPGYVPTEALVTHVNLDPTTLRFGGEGGHAEDRVYTCTIHYAVYASDGQVHTLVTAEAKLVGSDTPSVGDRERIAYDAAGDAVLLESDSERTANRLRYIKSAVQQGAEDRVAVAAAQATGRVRPGDSPVESTGRSVTMPWARKAAAAADAERERARRGDTPEKLLTLRGSTGLEVTVPFWDVDAEVEAGAEGVFFYHPHEPGLGYVVFPSPEHRRARDPVAAARQQLVAEIAKVR